MLSVNFDMSGRVGTARWNLTVHFGKVTPADQYRQNRPLDWHCPVPLSTMSPCLPVSG